MKKNLARGLTLLIVVPMLFMACFFGTRIYHLSNQRPSIKGDYSVVNNITQGLLSVNAWKDYLVQIIIHRIDDFEFKPEQEAVLKTQLEQVLNVVINKANTLINEKQITIKGKLKKLCSMLWSTIRKYTTRFRYSHRRLSTKLKDQKTKRN